MLECYHGKTTAPYWSMTVMVENYATEAYKYCSIITETIYSVVFFMKALLQIFLY